ncbi:addiction module protein [Gulosibacter molinativorax]|uniref:Addiction module protein n=1 Tax=Gulosibacter molinativorax TaxID=256821 RepID=A0ABT7C7Z8_9MICO|nr:addiction module protein [Gulosibacter molinativorax]MDJ1370857.1 hypothetical protein [Gulosibacter molinativorax]QUY62194.1 Hypotetical protein [Gulosibacter molinativorax]
MTPDTANFIREALTLDADQRAVVANVLIESLHEGPDTGEIDEAWHEEVNRRLTEVRDGSVELVDADDHYARLRDSLTALRSAADEGWADARAGRYVDARLEELNEFIQGLGEAAVPNVADNDH